MRTLLLVFVLFVVRVHGAYEYDCRRLNDCANGGTCTSGVCVCPTSPLAYTGDRCLQKVGGLACATDMCLNSGTCYVDETDANAEKCDCPYGFLGATCEKQAADVQCQGGSIQYDLSFPETFTGMVQLEADGAIPAVCEFVPSAAVDGVVTYTLVIQLSIQTDTDPTICGSEYITEIHETEPADSTSTKYERLVRIQYLANLVTAVDEIANMTCIHQDTGLTMSAEISSITLDGIGNLTVTDTDNFYSPVTMVLLDSGMVPLSPASALHVGDTFYIHMYITDTSMFKSIIIESCTANDTDAVNPKFFPMLDQRCPTKSGKKTAAMQEAHDVTQGTDPSLPGVRVPVKAFKFLFSDMLGLVCTVKLCQDGDTSCALPTDSDCESVINPPAPTEAGPTAGPTEAGPTDAATADAGPTDAATADAGPTEAGPTEAGPTDAGPTDAAPTEGEPEAGTPDTTGRRKRRSEDEKRTLSTVVTVLGPRDFTSDASKGDELALTVESCLARSEVMAILLVLGTIVCILFIACLVLALCLIRRRQIFLKGASSSPNNDRFQIPRAHVNGAYTRDV